MREGPSASPIWPEFAQPQLWNTTERHFTPEGHRVMAR